ncbi:GGDEF domain-containing protein [Sulfurirhabdus autotrophica]|uniref:Diguanylate cyclase (GGDEF)-like protein n=1 Tax=Sulfurirhabdus autotrophica TaxID=1706046 RepID=A0A4R3YCB1_9PROT|nr:GGDEF domain-containing protein [Sulfurirhabdus autotrophica]TCV89620.1 diguanylate cyclase (GGDEF)-like protein [Sulfurirhabdus autotrophica]
MIIELLSTKQVIIRIAAIIASAEFLIMLVLRIVPFEMNAIAEAVLDVMLLATLSTPAVYLWVIKPFVNARDDALGQISHLAFTDALTQLANRRHVLKHLERVLASSVRHKIFGALLVIDLDGFKRVNDDFGHDAGDAVLVEIATRFRSSIRTEDVAGRMGGDEFVVMVDHLDVDEPQAKDKSLRIAEKLINLANRPFDFNGHVLHVGASIGICLLGSERLDAVEALNKADMAMYRAKKSGKGCAVLYDKSWE